MVYKGNKISKKVCSWLNVNETKIDIKKIGLKSKHNLNNIKEIENKSFNNYIKQMDERFKNISYGISKEIIDLNRNNLEKYRYLADQGKINLDQDKNIKYYSKSRSGAIRFKVKDLSNVLLDIDLEKNADAIYIIEFEQVLNLVTRIFLEENSKLDLILIDRDEKNNVKLESIAVIAKNNSKVDIIKVDLSKGSKYFNYTSNLIEENAEVNIDLAYVLSNKDSYDMVFHQKHSAKNSKGNIFVEGVLKDNSTKIFKGTLEFKKGSEGSIGNEYESIINYSKDSKSISLPILLAHENNIKGNHSANHSEFDKAQLYYIQSCGFTIEEAKNIIAEAKIIPILDKVKNRSLKTELKASLKQILDNN